MPYNHFTPASRAASVQGGATTGFTICVIERVAEFIEQNRLLERGQSICVGFSGGADSTALLHILLQLQYDVIAAHVNHSQRVEADEHEARCREVAKQFGAGWISAKYDVPAMARELRIGLEEAGRMARYDFFKRIHDEQGHKTATAHTLDDSVETMLINLARGTGLKGLTGIPMRRENYIVRPLLEVRRADTIEYCHRIGITPLLDASNEDKRFARVRLREFMSAFESLHSGAILNAARSAKTFSEEDAFLDAVSAKAMHDCEITNNDPLAFLVKNDEVVLDAKRFLHLPQALSRRGIRLIADALGGQLSFDQVEAVLRLARESRRGSITAEGGKVAIEVAPDKMFLRRIRQTKYDLIPLPAPGEVSNASLGFRLAVCPTDEPPERPHRSLTVVVDADSIVGQLGFRPLVPGDRIRPYRAPGEKKIAELLTDRKVGAFVKSRLPIVCDEAGPVWVPTVCIADRVKVTSETKRRYRLEFGGSV